MDVVETRQAPQAIGPYSQGISAGGFLFTSGQIPLSPESGQIAGETIEEQAECCLSNLLAVLRAGGSGPDRVLKTTCYLKCMEDFQAFNQVYERRFAPAKPARSCVAVRELPKDVLCEIEAVALTGAYGD